MKLIKLLSQRLLEAEGDEEQQAVGSDQEAADQLKQAFKSTSVEDFVTKFKSIASDPKVQAVLKAGQTDADPKDEVAVVHVTHVGGCSANLVFVHYRVSFDV